MTNKYISYRKIKKELLADKAVKKAYDDLESKYSIIKIVIDRRIKQGLTQAQLAKKIGTKQSAISRLERGDYNPSLSFLDKVAKGLDAKLKISIS